MSKEIDPRDLIDCLQELKDPRIDRTKKHGEFKLVGKTALLYKSTYLSANIAPFIMVDFISYLSYL